jgi:Arsenate reductase and related proteins, glutaredoxin family
LQKKIEFNERDFFKKPLSRDEIEKLLQGRPAAEMFSFRSPSFKKMGVDQDKLTDSDLIELMLKEPRLVRRPVVRIGKKVYFDAASKFLADVLK